MSVAGTVVGFGGGPVLAGTVVLDGTVVLTAGLVLIGRVVGEVEALFERTSFAVW